MLFITVEELKTKLGATAINIVKSPKTNKLFGNTSNGKNLKVEQTLDSTKEVRFMYESDDTFDSGCIVNVKPSNPPVAVL